MNIFLPTPPLPYNEIVLLKCVESDSNPNYCVTVLSPCDEGSQKVLEIIGIPEGLWELFCSVLDIHVVR